MSPTSLLARCFLALALVAGGLPASAMPSDPAAAPTEAAACHEAVDHGPVSPDADASDDCCGAGDCSCSCLHHAPAVPGSLAWVAPHRPQQRIPRGLAHGPPESAESPRLRPPIV